MVASCSSTGPPTQASLRTILGLTGRGQWTRTHSMRGFTHWSPRPWAPILSYLRQTGSSRFVTCCPYFIPVTRVPNGTAAFSTSSNRDWQALMFRQCMNGARKNPPSQLRECLLEQGQVVSCLMQTIEGRCFQAFPSLYQVCHLTEPRQTISESQHGRLKVNLCATLHTIQHLYNYASLFSPF